MDGLCDARCDVRLCVRHTAALQNTKAYAALTWKDGTAKYTLFQRVKYVHVLALASTGENG